MNRGIHSMAPKPVPWFSLLAMAFTAIGSTCYAEEHQGVGKQDGSVSKNDKIDSAHEDEANPEEVTSLAGGRIRILSKTFTPPAGYKFVLFPGTATHVDIHDDPAVNGERIAGKDTETEIKIAGTFVYDTAAEFPLRGEGNLSVVSGGSGGSGGTPLVLHWAAKTRKLKVNLVIHNGQGGAAVPEDIEESVGAFTVANLNDTDGNGAIDRDQSTVPGEVDLMEINLLKPVPDLGGEVTLSSLGGSIKVWDSATKGTEVTISRQYPTNELPKTLWIEARATSAGLRDIGLQLEYKGAKDVVRATGIWVTHNRMLFSPTDVLPPDMGANILPGYAPLLTPLGQHTSPAPIGITNALVNEFTVAPSGVGSEPGIVFDVTRQMVNKSFFTRTNDTIAVIDKPDETGDIANDEVVGGTNDDNDNSPTNNHIYSVDGPGLNSNAAIQNIKAVTIRFNAREFTRVRVNGQTIMGNGLQGSRASDKFLWYARVKVELAPGGTTYERIPGVDNTTGLGNPSLGTTP